MAVGVSPVIDHSDPHRELAAAKNVKLEIGSVAQATTPPEFDADQMNRALDINNNIAPTFTISGNVDNGDPRKTGGVYAIHADSQEGGNALAQSPVGSNEWFTMDVIAQGDRVQVKINDKEVTNFRDSIAMALYCGCEVGQPLQSFFSFLSHFSAFSSAAAGSEIVEATSEVLAVWPG